METSLHRQLKHHFAADSNSVEVTVDGFRIDAIDSKGFLVEIQHAGLGAIRNKATKLLENGHGLRIIKPLISCKWIETFDRPGGTLLRRRKSPKKLAAIDIYRDLIHFTQVFPRSKLTLEVLSVECIEQRIDRANKRRRRKQYMTLDQHLAKVGEINVLKGIPDLWRLLGNPKLPLSFDTKELAEKLGQPRWFAQQIAYTLSRCGATEITGKRGNSIVYSRIGRSLRKQAAKEWELFEPQALAYFLRRGSASASGSSDIEQREP